MKEDCSQKICSAEGVFDVDGLCTGRDVFEYVWSRRVVRAWWRALSRRRFVLCIIEEIVGRTHLLVFETRTAFVAPVSRSSVHGSPPGFRADDGTRCSDSPRCTS